MNEDLDLAINGRNLIKKWEGLRLVGYLCPAGIPTIGWGHTGPEVFVGMRISEEQAERYLTEDVQWAERVIERYVTADLNQHQFDALVSFIYNIGEGNFRGSTALRRINAGDVNGAAEAITWWNKARNPNTGQLEVLQGLVNRRAEEAALFRSQPVSITAGDIQHDMAEEMPQQVEARTPNRTLGTTQEVLTTVGAAGSAATTVGSFFSQLSPIAQVALIVGVFVIVGVGGYFIYQRWKDKSPMKRREVVE